MTHRKNAPMASVLIAGEAWHDDIDPRIALAPHSAAVKVPTVLAKDMLMLSIPRIIRWFCSDT